MSRWIVCVFTILFFATAVLAEKPTTTQPAAKEATQPTAVIPSIEGAWEEAPGVIVKISQTDGAWSAKCSYQDKDGNEIKWEIKSATITADGKLKGKLHHTQAPAGWVKWQVREATVSNDGLTITGTAKWEGGFAKFTWAKQPDKLPPPKVGDSEDSIAAYCRTQGKDVYGQQLYRSRVLSETAEGKVIQVYRFTGDGFVDLDTYTVLGKQIVRIDHP